jgi:hypothetical protein
MFINGRKHDLALNLSARYGGNSAFMSYARRLSYRFKLATFQGDFKRLVSLRYAIVLTSCRHYGNRPLHVVVRRNSALTRWYSSLD